MNIKIDGVTEIKQLQQLEGLEIDFAGLSFDEDSPKFVGDKLNKKEVKKADFDLKKTGVFTNPSLSQVLDVIDEYGIEVVQLNGSELPELCDDLSTEVEVIKTFSINGNENIDELISDYDAVCDFYLFNLTGKLDISFFNQSKIEKPFFIGGDITVEDMPVIKKFKHPDFLGISLANQLESESGVLDMRKILVFLQAGK